MEFNIALLSLTFLGVLGFLFRNAKFEYVPEPSKSEIIEFGRSEDYEIVDVYDNGDEPSIIWAFLCLALGPLGFILLLIVWLAPSNPKVRSVKYRRVN